MKIISTKEYNKLKKTQSAYLDLLMKPLQGVFEKVTDDDLLRENGLLNAENEKLNNIINEFDEWLKEKKEQMEEFEFYKRKETGAFWYSTMGDIETFIEKIKELKGVDKE